MVTDGGVLGEEKGRAVVERLDSATHGIGHVLGIEYRTSLNEELAWSHEQMQVHIADMRDDWRNKLQWGSALELVNYATRFSLDPMSGLLTLLTLLAGKLGLTALADHKKKKAKK